MHGEGEELAEKLDSGDNVGEGREWKLHINRQREASYLPFGLAKWITLPSSLNMLTSSMPGRGCTLSFFSVPCSFFSSVPVLLWTFLTFRRGVPFPLCNKTRISFRGAGERKLHVLDPRLG